MDLRRKMQPVLSGTVFGLLFFVQPVTGQATAGEFEKLADEQRNAKKYDEAVRLYSECLRLEPKNSGCLTQRAWIYVNQLKKYELAIADYNELISSFPEKENYIYYLTQFRYNRGFAYEEIGNLDAAFKDYSEALRLSPKDFKSYFGLVTVSYKKGDNNAALGQVNRAADTILDPVVLGRLNKALNDKTAAEAAFKKALELDPNNREAQNELAALNGQPVTTKTSFPNIPESLKSYESAYRAKLEYAKTQKDATGYRATALRDYFVALGVIWNMNSDEKAKFIVKWFMEMIEIDPKAAYNGFLDAYYVQNNKELLAKVEALLPAAHLAALNKQKALPKIANLPSVYEYYNVYTYFDGSWTMDIYPVGNPSIKNVEIRITKKADDIYTIRMFPGTGDERTAELVKRITAPSYASLATEVSFSLYNRQFSGTVAGYQMQGTTADGGKWNASKNMVLDYYYYGLEEFNAKRNENALAYFSKAIEMDSSYAKFFNSRGMTYRIMGQLDLAIADLNDSLKINPNDSQVKKTLDSLTKLLEENKNR